MKQFTNGEKMSFDQNNIDLKTVAGFGDEWKRFDQSELDENEIQGIFAKYFSIFPWDLLPENAHGFDMGCGSGRWAKLVADKVGVLHCIEPSSAIEIAKINLSDHKNCVFHKHGVGENFLPEGTMDFGYSLGVLHHIPDTEKGVRDSVKLLKSGAPFLLYVYYSLENRSTIYRSLWKISDFFRLVISRLPFGPRYLASQIIALFVYLPLARLAALLEKIGLSEAKAQALPLGFYRNLSFYTIRTDSLDRFGTRIEKRFTRYEIELMMRRAGLTNICFSDLPPYWCAVGIKV